MSLGPSATIRCAEGNHREPFPKPLDDRGRAGAAFFCQGSPTSRAQCWTHRGAVSTMLCTATPACLPANTSRLAEQIPAAYMLKICRCMRPQMPKYLIVFANEAAQYLSKHNLQVPLIFPTVWCLLLTAGERVVNRRAHLWV